MMVAICMQRQTNAINGKWLIVLLCAKAVTVSPCVTVAAYNVLVIVGK